MQQIFSSARVDDEAMCEAMKRSVKDFSYLPCPHTAVALGARCAAASAAVTGSVGCENHWGTMEFLVNQANVHSNKWLEVMVDNG